MLPPVTRRLDWRSRLHSWADSQVGRPRIWGETDCAALARTALEVMFDQDVLSFLPRWTSAREALAAMRAHDSAEAIMLRIGAQAHTFGFVRSGDVVVVPRTHNPPRGPRPHPMIFVCLDATHCLTCTEERVEAGPLPLELRDRARAFSLWSIPAEVLKPAEGECPAK